VSNKKAVLKKAAAVVAATTACETRQRKVLNDRAARFLPGTSDALVRAGGYKVNWAYQRGSLQQSKLWDALDAA
jgi:hypothetical protein